MSSHAQHATDTQTVFRKIGWRLIPFLCLLYFVAYLDRVNVSFAALTMNADLGLSAAAYGFGAGVFFLGYFFFEVPSNLLLTRVGARRWIARIMVTWGLVSMAMAFVTGPTSFYVLRCALGVAEAGFFPGIIYYLTFWFPNRSLAAMVGFFILANPLANMIGAPLSTLLLDTHLFSLAGWQTLFVIEAFPAIVLGFVVLAWLPDSPARAAWLNEAERTIVQEEIERERHPNQRVSLLDAFSSARVWMLALIYFGLNFGVYGFGFWVPQIIRSLGSFSITQTGIVTALPYACGAIAMFLWGHHSDRTGERRWHLALATSASAIGFLIASTAAGVWLAIAGLTLGAAGLYAALPVFWTFPTAMLSGTAAAAGIALINSIGTLSGYVGPVLLGRLKEATGNDSSGLGALAGSMLLVGILSVVAGKVRQDNPRAP